MENQFVPYELAVKLKELGFDEKCFMSYFKLLRHEFEDFRSSSNIIFNEDEPIKLLTFSNDEYCEIQCGAPLWQQAFDWVEKHLGVFVAFDKIDNSRGLYYDFTIVDSIKRDYFDEDLIDSASRDYDMGKYDTLLEAKKGSLEKIIKSATTI